MLLQLQLGSESAGLRWGQLFIAPSPSAFFLNGEKEVESTVDLQHSYVNKSSSVPPAVIWLNLVSWFRKQELNQLTEAQVNDF